MRQRHGFTLIEVMVALVIMAIVTGAIYSLLNTSQRVSLAQSERVSLQSTVRTGSLIVPNELRELNTVLGSLDPSQSDILVANNTDITYRAMRGLGTLCQAPVAPVTQLTLSETSWSGLRHPLADRDSLYLFVDGNESVTTDDAWIRVAITAVANPANACGGTPGIQLTVLPVAPAVTIPVVPLNTPVRLFEVMKLELYTADGEWWLGARSTKVDLAPQPVLGPLTAAGFGLEYLAANGNPTADLTAIKSIRVTVRGLTDNAIRGSDGVGTMAHRQETLVSQVLLRNSIRP